VKRAYRAKWFDIKGTVSFFIISLMIVTSLFIVTAPIVTDASSTTIPRQVVLTWQGSTQTTMTITWRTDEQLPNPKVLYTSNPNADIDDYEEAFGSSETFEGTTAWINSVELTDLTPGTEYYVVIPHQIHEERFKFRTAPEDPEEVVFIAVSDFHLTGTSSGRSRRRTVMKAIADENPDFVIMVGDLWYHNENDNDDVNASVDGFFDDLHEALITSDGRRIPVLPVEGNHDGIESFVSAGTIPAKENAPFYYNRFKLPGEEGCYVLQYGPDLTLIGLNSGHSIDNEGHHTEWLEQTLQQYQSSEWIIPFHHVGPYPCYRSVNDTYSTKVRTNWVPLYEQYGVDLVISGHDHAYKRTYPIRNNQIDYENGIVYIGDGGSVSGLREPYLDRWYIFEAASEYNFFKLTMTKQAGKSTLYVEPKFPINPNFSGTPFYLIRDNDMADVTRTESELTFDKFSNEDISKVTQDLILPDRGFNDTRIEWHSSHPDIIGTTGVVNRPSYGEENQTVTLTATITKGEATKTKEFIVTVLAAYESVGIGMEVNYDTKEVMVVGEYEFIGGNDITLLVTNKQGYVKYIDQKIRETSGSFQFGFNMDEDGIGAKYVLKVGAADREHPYKTEFILTPEATDIAVRKIIFSNSVDGLPIERLVPGKDIYISVNMFNNTEEDIHASVVAALYDSDGQLIHLVFQEKEIPGKKEEEANLKLSTDTEGDYVKLFIWDGFSTVRPLAKTIIFPE